MYLEHLTTFVNLAETLNFSKTAVNLNISQSSVSQAIASIEKQLGVTLFYRSRKAVSLTPAGQEFYDRVKPWLNEYNKAVQHVQQVQNAQKMNLTIGYSGTPYEHTVVPELVRAFCQEHPQINVFLENYAHQELKDHLTHGNCDVIFTMPDIIAGMDNLAYHSLLIGYYCLIVPSEVKLGPSPVSLDMLSQSRLIFLDHRWCPPTQDQLQKEICRNNHSLDLAYVNNIATARAMVKARLGWGIWANFVSDPNDLDLKKLPLSTKIVPDYGVSILIRNLPDSSSAGWRRQAYRDRDVGPVSSYAKKGCNPLLDCIPILFVGFGFENQLFYMLNHMTSIAEIKTSSSIFCYHTFFLLATS